MSWTAPDLNGDCRSTRRRTASRVWARGDEREFDDIDRLTMRSNPELVEPKQTKKKKAKTDRSVRALLDQSSEAKKHVHQVEICVAYYLKLGGRNTHCSPTGAGPVRTWIATACSSLSLPSKRDEIEIIVFYSFDRLSRDLFSAMDFYRILEDHGVELHCARSGRRYTKEDAAREAMEAENDRKLRTERTTDGLDELVAIGGLPWEPTSASEDG